MKQSQLFSKTRREAPKDETSKNARLLIRGGFINKEMAGVYSFLPLGLIVLNKVIAIIRQEINAIGGQEILMSGLQDPQIWKASGRWEQKVVDSWFKTNLANGGEVGLSFTHEEPIARIMTNHIKSHKDLPKYVYQFQTKFRNEKRSQGGLLRTREFIMKDLYSFSESEEQLDIFYKKVKNAYLNIFKRLGIGDKTYYTLASGGVFSKYSHEFQTVCEVGEDEIYIQKGKQEAVNKEIITNGGFTLKGETPDNPVKSIEVGNIFKLGTKYSEALGLYYTDREGSRLPVVMGSYGIAPSRSLGTVVELLSDNNGIVWPETISPFKYHILCDNNSKDAIKHSNALYDNLVARGVEVLLDDREESLPAKIMDADLIGCAYRVIVSKKSLDAGGIEIKGRKEAVGKIVSPENLLQISTCVS